MNSRRAIFLDRDGTLIEDKHYLADPAKVVLLPHAAEGLRAFAELGYLLVVVSNQSGVGRGFFREAAVHAVNDKVASEFAAHGVGFEGFYHCPHSPDDCCTCRKPLPGMIRRACTELDIDPRQSIMIGDRLTDVQAGNALGMQSILLHREKSTLDQVHLTCPDLMSAFRIILRQTVN